MDRESQTATARTPLAEQLGPVGLWTRQLDIQPTDQLRTTIAELEELGWRSLWSWEVLGEAYPGRFVLGIGGSDRLVDAMVAWGSPEAIAERVQAHLEAGADHVCLHVLDPDPNALPTGAWRTLAPALLGG
jgi:hypothetical protein